MQAAEQTISLYHTLFLIFLVLTVIFALLSILLFFTFRIRQVFDFLTGRGEKRTIRQMEEENAKTGKLRQEYAGINTSSDLYRTPSGSIPPTLYPTTGKMYTGTEPTEQTSSSQHQEHMADSRMSLDGSAPTDMLGGQAEGSEETTLLHKNEGDEETTLLNKNDSSEVQDSESKTVVLNQEMLAAAAMAKAVGRFEIIKESIWIHTDERI